MSLLELELEVRLFYRDFFRNNVFQTKPYSISFILQRNWLPDVMMKLLQHLEENSFHKTGEKVYPTKLTGSCHFDSETEKTRKADLKM